MNKKEVKRHLEGRAKGAKNNCSIQKSGFIAVKNNAYFQQKLYKKGVKRHLEGSLRRTGLETFVLDTFYF